MGLRAYDDRDLETVGFRVEHEQSVELRGVRFLNFRMVRKPHGA